MKITMVGTGYVGLVTGTLFADRGNEVVCVDNNEEIIEDLNNGKVHIYEPGLERLVKNNLANGNLKFTYHLREPVLNSKVIFIAVGTPSDEDGSFDLRYVKSVAEEIGDILKDAEGFKVVVGKSTVPQGTYELVNNIFNNKLKGAKVRWGYVSNPETLAEGTAISDFAKPDRIIIGTHSDEAFRVMQELYHPFNIQSDRIIRGSPADAELAKLFSNTALATRIATINEFARIADITPEADMDIIRKMVCEDQRIGYKFMFPSPGYGGSCFPKDVQGLAARARENGYDPLLLSQIHHSNEAHKNYMGERVQKLLTGDKVNVAVWGLTFKPNTDDMRDAASVPIIERLIKEGARVVAYDPQDGKARQIFGDKVNFAEDKYAAVKDADALILLTEWKEFDAPDFDRLKELMQGNLIFDLRNRWLPKAANNHGFNYYGVGRNYPLQL
ncbi:UDP-glucose/GDP-mannose dehydrogenase family protein [Candidatus Woesearchaeota archaeon]|nr:UDP-glucose/GDP-mannose dehydrogenase family protein [Candidatus Woesearchaeota archaeon]